MFFSISLNSSPARRSARSLISAQSTYRPETPNSSPTSSRDCFCSGNLSLTDSGFRFRLPAAFFLQVSSTSPASAAHAPFCDCVRCLRWKFSDQTCRNASSESCYGLSLLSAFGFCMLGVCWRRECRLNCCLSRTENGTILETATEGEVR